VAEEALTNVHKHAQTGKVQLAIERCDDAVRLQLTDK
jgi:signal transduction histidine kinase